MALNSNLKEQLKKIHTLVAAKGVAFANPRSPIVSALVTNGVIVVGGTPDPTDGNKFSVTLTDTGLAELGLSAPTPHTAPVPAAAPAPTVQEAPQASPAPATAPVADAPAKQPATATSAAKPRLVPIIHATGARIKMPVVERGGNFGKRTETYPFSKLDAPEGEGDEKLFDSFFVATTAENPHPTKSLAGTVSSANKRFALDGKKFSVVHVKQDGEHGVEGARVLRIA